MENNNNQEEDQIVTPWEVAAEKGGKIDYDKLINKFGCQRLDQSLIDRVARPTSSSPAASSLPISTQAGDRLRRRCIWAISCRLCSPSNPDFNYFSC